ncbi:MULTISPECIES: NAD(P)/FAD-dependent oxidoreductase [unclassified Clostridium]|uniref:NAD(P)/FAD-dependent oxidoreductase n=1 Tax=unclassified Clostridium TaxID=2614128 RepID=UPI000297300C|nr:MULTISPECIES: NAD(P)/FAD-dependent oxidoreductase [unclassified Clostridium]EKQ51306.1 MAG: protoporphyrinogen oxidase [Clostridium sp. Maddingley MBC34-26]
MEKVIIIGAGPAGLTAAYKLLKNTEIKPIIIEESESIGGISRTVVYKDNRMDLGGHRFFTKNEQVMNIWKELMPIQGYPSKDDIMLSRELEIEENGPDPEKGEEVLLKRRRISRIFYLRNFFNYPITLSFETFYNMGIIRTIKAGIGYIKACLIKRKENSLEDFYINRFGQPLYEMFFEDYTEKLWGVHPSKIAPDWGAQRVKGLSLFKVILSMLAKPFKGSKGCETSLIEEFYYPKKGHGQLWETMADKIIEMGGEIIFDSRVNSIEVRNNKIARLMAQKSNGEISEYKNVKTVFSSMPIKDLIKSLGNYPPKDIINIAENLPYRDFITVGLLLKKLKLENKTEIKTVSDIIPDCWIYIQERDVKIGRLQIFNNWSPYLVNDLENTVWIGLEYFCNENDEMWSMSEEVFINFAIDELCKINIINKDDVLDSKIIKVKKAYPAYFGSYKNFDSIKDYINSIDNLYCIGRNGQHRYNNMDHSMLTALEAVASYINDGINKHRIWDVNAEEEYHEIKTS